MITQENRGRGISAGLASRGHKLAANVYGTFRKNRSLLSPIDKIKGINPV
jgi:hypothetical protein